MLFRRVAGHLKKQEWTDIGIEFLIVVLGVFLGIQAANWNDQRVEHELGRQYLAGFREDLLADSSMLDIQIEWRQKQLADALIVLEFFEGRPAEPDVFFAAYYSILFERNILPSRNTMDEVLNAGGLRLIEDAVVRSSLLDLYASYAKIEGQEDHIARDFDSYLYDPTFSKIPIQIEGPWPDTPANRGKMQQLLGDVTIENGVRLIVANLQPSRTGLEAQLTSARGQVERLLQAIPAD